MCLCSAASIGERSWSAAAQRVCLKSWFMREPAFLPLPSATAQATRPDDVTLGYARLF